MTDQLYIRSFLLVTLILLCGCQPSIESNQMSRSSASSPLPNPTVGIATTAAPPVSSTVTVTDTKTPSELLRYSTTSPDGLWTAETVVTPGDVGTLRVSFTARRANGEAAWVIVDEERPQGLGFPSPQVLLWQPSAPALYYTEAALPDGCASAPYHSGLYHLDLTTGELSTIDEKLAGFIALAPGGDWLAYHGATMSSSQAILVIRNLANSAENNVKLPLAEGEKVVNFVWSPEGFHLLIIANRGPCLESAATILMADVTTGAVTTVGAGVAGVLYALEWPEPDMVLLQGRDQQRLSLNIQTGELSD